MSVETSHPTMGAWIEITMQLKDMFGLASHPTMGAWIEIGTKSEMERLLKVAPHDGCVD